MVDLSDTLAFEHLIHRFKDIKFIRLGEGIGILSFQLLTLTRSVITHTHSTEWNEKIAKPFSKGIK